MKNLVLIALCLLSAPAFAGSVFIPGCPATGEIELLSKRASNSVYGHIGRDSVSFNRYQELIYGEYNGFDVSLQVNGVTVTGTIGTERVNLDYRGGVIRGTAICVD